MKFGGGIVMVWGLMTWNGAGKLEFINVIMGSGVNVNILIKNLLASTQKLRMGKHFIFKQDTDSKHMSKKAKEFTSRSRLNYLNGWL